DGLAGVQPSERAAVRLAELVAIDRVCEEISEVVEQPQRGVNDITLNSRLPDVARLREAARKAEAIHLPAVGWIERPQSANEPLIDGTLGYLVGRGPAIGVAHRGEREAVAGGALAITHHAI